MSKPMLVYSQITHHDVETQIRHEFMNKKHLNKGNVSNIVGFIKSRGQRINPFHCFIFLKIECCPVLHDLLKDELKQLISKMVIKVKECLEGLMLSRPVERGENCNRWANPEYQDEIFFNPENKSLIIERAENYQQRFPLTINVIFILLFQTATISFIHAV